MNINKKIVIATPTVLEQVVRRCALFIKSAPAFAVLAVASVPPMDWENETRVAYNNGAHRAGYVH